MFRLGIDDYKAAEKTNIDFIHVNEINSQKPNHGQVVRTLNDIDVGYGYT